MKMTKQGITKMVNHSESLLEELLSSITANQLEILEYCAIYLDTGHINHDSTRWAMMIYYTSPAMPVRKMNSFNYWYVYQDLYMAALIRLEDHLRNKKDLYEHMDFSMQFFRGPNQTIDNTNKVQTMKSTSEL